MNSARYALRVFGVTDSRKRVINEVAAIDQDDDDDDEDETVGLSVEERYQRKCDFIWCADGGCNVSRRMFQIQMSTARFTSAVMEPVITVDSG
ncbi:hypothetical protein Nepgr_029897 [Nepenthes gracilis]|uniref:Uncharacterized protein n=1 Tax=Nepenthes gracilis TaxID=150966 RepID=A0AAD3TF89_NEPGR|nr:hypothetical protein Nepgr_029897 [Nepenthes gracilis]